jgi:hypothetical protein
LGADLDGDGRADSLSVLRGADTSTLHLTPATGESSELAFPTCGASFLGIADLDGRPLIFYGQCGATVSNALLATVVDGRLQAVSARTDDGAPFDAASWGAHSNGVPEGTADVACAPYDGRDALVVTRSVVSNADGTEIDPVVFFGVPVADRVGRYQRDWDRTIYVLDGSTLRAVVHDGGTIGYGEAAPDGVPLDNALACPGVGGSG